MQLDARTDEDPPRLNITGVLCSRRALQAPGSPQHNSQRPGHPRSPLTQHVLQQLHALQVGHHVHCPLWQRQWQRGQSAVRCVRSRWELLGWR